MAKSTPTTPVAVPATPAKGEPGAAGLPTGQFTPPPAHAPHEVSQPLDAKTIITQQEKAHQNEKELAPLKFALDKAIASTAASTLGGPVQTAVPAAAPDAPSGSAAPNLPLSTLLPVQPPLNSHPPIVPEGVAPPTAAQPAASNTDSPSRGMPKPITDPGKKITGGWGEDGGFEPQYYALDGTELLALIRTTWQQLQYDLDRDLRFGIACCYPQVAVRVTIEVGGAHASATINDIAFNIESRVHLLSGTKVDDNSTPADALRVEAGLDRPFKHVVRTPTGTFIVDRETKVAEALSDPDNVPTQPEP